MNDRGVYTIETDGRQSCYHVMGEDEKCYGSFMKAGQAKHLKRKLEEETGGNFYVETYSLGTMFESMMDDYEE